MLWWFQGNEGYHLELRQQVVDFMEENADDFAPYMEDDEDFTSYCTRMRKAAPLSTHLLAVLSLRHLHLGSSS